MRAINRKEIIMEPTYRNKCDQIEDKFGQLIGINWLSFLNKLEGLNIKYMITATQKFEHIYYLHPDVNPFSKCLQTDSFTMKRICTLKDNDACLESINERFYIVE